MTCVWTSLGANTLDQHGTHIQPTQTVWLYNLHADVKIKHYEDQPRLLITCYWNLGHRGLESHSRPCPRVTFHGPGRRLLPDYHVPEQIVFFTHPRLPVTNRFASVVSVSLRDPRTECGTLEAWPTVLTLATPLWPLSQCHIVYPNRHVDTWPQQFTRQSLLDHITWHRQLLADTNNMSNIWKTQEPWQSV